MCLSFPSHNTLHVTQRIFYQLINFSAFISKDYTLIISHMRFIMLHDVRQEDGIKNFFTDVYDLYIKVWYVLYLVKSDYKRHANFGRTLDYRGSPLRCTVLLPPGRTVPCSSLIRQVPYQQLNMHAGQLIVIFRSVSFFPFWCT